MQFVFLVVTYFILSQFMFNFPGHEVGREILYLHQAIGKHYNWDYLLIFAMNSSCPMSLILSSIPVLYSYLIGTLSTQMPKTWQKVGDGIGQGPSIKVTHLATFKTCLMNST